MTLGYQAAAWIDDVFTAISIVSPVDHLGRFTLQIDFVKVFTMTVVGSTFTSGQRPRDSYVINSLAEKQS